MRNNSDRVGSIGSDESYPNPNTEYKRVELSTDFAWTWDAEFVRRETPGTIKAHCMGTPFPPTTAHRPVGDAFCRFLEAWAKKIDRDIVGEKAKEQTSGKTDRSQP